MNDPTKIVRPECMELIDEVGGMRTAEGPPSDLYWPDVGGQLYEWSKHLESRLAKYETHHPDPKPGEASIVKHTEYDPDRRPRCMDFIPLSDGDDKIRLTVHLVDALKWAKYLEQVREGLQRQLNHWERMYQQDHDPKRNPKSAN